MSQTNIANDKPLTQVVCILADVWCAPYIKTSYVRRNNDEWTKGKRNLLKLWQMQGDWLKAQCHWITYHVIVIITMTLHHTYGSPTDRLTDWLVDITFVQIYWMNFLFFSLNFLSIIRVRLPSFSFLFCAFAICVWTPGGGELARRTEVKSNRQWVWVCRTDKHDYHTSSVIRLPSAAHFFFFLIVWMSCTCHLVSLLVHENVIQGRTIAFWCCCCRCRRLRFFFYFSLLTIASCYTPVFTYRRNDTR